MNITKKEYMEFEKVKQAAIRLCFDRNELSNINTGSTDFNNSLQKFCKMKGNSQNVEIDLLNWFLRERIALKSPETSPDQPLWNETRAQKIDNLDDGQLLQIGKFIFRKEGKVLYNETGSGCVPIRVLLSKNEFKDLLCYKVSKMNDVDNEFLEFRDRIKEAMKDLETPKERYEFLHEKLDQVIKNTDRKNSMIFINERD